MKEGGGRGRRLPILRRFNVENSNKPNYDNTLCNSDFSYDKPETYQNIQELQNNKEEEGEALPILRRFGIETSSIVNDDNTLRQENFSYGMTDNWADDVKEFVELCEQGILYDDLMRRLNIPPKKKRLLQAIVLLPGVLWQNQNNRTST